MCHVCDSRPNLMCGERQTTDVFVQECPQEDDKWYFCRRIDHTGTWGFTTPTMAMNNSNS
jgi:hypothetical protein